MARPRNTTYDADLIKLNSQIEKYEISMKALQQTREQLINKRKEIEIHMLHDTLKRSGKSVQDVIQALDAISRNKTSIPSSILSELSEPPTPSDDVGEDSENQDAESNE